MASMQRTAVIAIGGNALIADGQEGTIDEQFGNARDAAREVAGLVEDGWRVVVTHGNGPQVGFILLRSEMLSGAPFIPKLTLDMCVADSEGGIGYIVGNSLSNEFGRRGLNVGTVCVLTQTVVDANDLAFKHPTKPIGSAFSAEDADKRRLRDGWSMVEDAGRGYRRVVPSPKPVGIVETGAIKALLDAGFVVVAAGGGGIPVVEDAPGVYRGVEAVIDKDLASAYLAARLGVPLLVISTGVERVAVHYRQPDQRELEWVGLPEVRRYLAEGEFPEGSMGPKIRAAIEFLDQGGEEVVITSLACLSSAVTGHAGTHITR
ncbi:MAG: carbamate kinase [Chloroflexi bacterium]|nr:carbamate kinase [Chloroflexota bacterium]